MITRRDSILSVYGPVLLAAVLILGAAPGCIMPGCSAAGAAATAGLCAPGQAATAHAAEAPRYATACGTVPSDGPASPPCHDGDSGVVMTHGTPDATVAVGADVPVPAVLVHAIEVPRAVVCSRAPEAAPAPEPPPPDPLGVRLTI